MTRPAATSGIVNLLLVPVGFVTGGLLAVILSVVLWPGGVAALLPLLDRPAPDPDEVRHAELLYGAMLGLFGAIVPSAGYRVGYAVAALLVVAASGHYWGAHDLGLPLLLAVGVWLSVAGAIGLTGDALRPRRVRGR